MELKAHELFSSSSCEFLLQWPYRKKKKKRSARGSEVKWPGEDGFVLLLKSFWFEKSQAPVLETSTQKESKENEVIFHYRLSHFISPQ